jgi:predicted adenylyl cyclase CyaB
MPRNIEIKARIASVRLLVPSVTRMADEGPTEIFQDDTLFACSAGRLKLRAFSEHDGQLIFYQRSDSAGPKESYYVISPTSSPETLRQALSLAHGVVGRVRKHRTLFMVGRTRVHLDKVEGLGDFLELEVVLAEGERLTAGMAVANELLSKLAIPQSQLIDKAYIDMLSTNMSVSSATSTL